MIELYKKIRKARDIIHEMDVKKKGHNDYSNYDYYTPEQVDMMVRESSQKVGLFNKFDMSWTDGNVIATLKIVDMDTGEHDVFSMTIEIPDLKASNAAQGHGGAMTYAKRYLMMDAYDIVDNSLDPDSSGGKKKSKSKNNNTLPKSNTKQYKNLIAYVAKNGVNEKVMKTYTLTEGQIKKIKKDAEQSKG